MLLYKYLSYLVFKPMIDCKYEAQVVAAVVIQTNDPSAWELIFITATNRQRCTMSSETIHESTPKSTEQINLSFS